jgi:hypothetical protein
VLVLVLTEAESALPGFDWKTTPGGLSKTELGGAARDTGVVVSSKRRQTRSPFFSPNGSNDPVPNACEIVVGPRHEGPQVGQLPCFLARSAAYIESGMSSVQLDVWVSLPIVFVVALVCDIMRSASNANVAVPAWSPPSVHST